MGLGTRVIVDCIVDVYRVHERTMFRRLWRSLEKGDIVLGDKGFGSYAEVASLLKMGVDFVFRQRQDSLRTKEARKIGKDEWIVTWERPSVPGDWVQEDELPARIEIRAIRFRTEIKGFRSKEIILFTSLTDRKQYPKEALMELYYRRWEMELRIRDIKSTMGLSLLRSKTPGGSRKELWMGLLAYNLVRGIMLDAAHRGRLPISRVSFKRTIRCLDAFSSSPLVEENLQRTYLLYLDFLIAAQVPERKGRIEPRKIKKRPKNKYSLLTIPRNAARNEVLSA
jgi:IS4 transposase